MKGTSAVDSSWIQPFMEYQEGARLIAESFNAVWVPFQEVFDIAVEHASPAYWTPDGVHPPQDAQVRQAVGDDHKVVDLNPKGLVPK